MRVFVTGATGFIGFAIVQELLAAGHQVTGLARSENSGRKLLAAGAKVHIGSVVHGPADHGFAPQLIQIARKKRESAYVGDGLNRWPAVHQRDAARLFRLALENGKPGGTCHGVAEEGVPFGDIASRIAGRLNVPTVSRSPAQAAKQFSFLASFVGIDNPTSSRLTQQRLGWQPTECTLFSDLDRGDYFNA